jgi:hypothetical protein
VANAFNTFFLTITAKLNIQQVEKGNSVSFLEDSFSGNFPSMKTIPITEAEIKSVIHSLKPKKSSGYDEIPVSKILKACASLISHPLSYSCNHSLHTGVFPDHLKIVVVKPLYKKGDKTSMTSYRPISLLTVFLKYLRKLCTVG